MAAHGATGALRILTGGLFNSEVQPGGMVGCGGPRCKMGIFCNDPEKVRIKVKGEEQSPGILRKQQESGAVVPFRRPRKEVCSPSQRFEINLGNTVRPSKRGRGQGVGRERVRSG